MSDSTRNPDAAYDDDSAEAFEGTLMDGLEDEPPYPTAAKCQECGGGRGDHGLGCPKGPHPMAGETMRFDPGSFDRAVRGVETRGRDHV